LLVVVASLRERLRINSDLMASSKTVKLPEGLARLSVARSGVVDFEYDVLQAHPRGELSIGSVDQEDN